MDWPDEDLALLRKLIEKDKLSAGKASRILKRSRSAIVGKCRRMKIALQPPVRPKKGSMIKRTPREPKKPKTPFNMRVMTGESVSTAPLPELIPTPSATLVELDRHRCRWPIGDPQAQDFGFCGRYASASRYCAVHTDAARSKTVPRDWEFLAKYV